MFFGTITSHFDLHSPDVREAKEKSLEGKSRNPIYDLRLKRGARTLLYTIDLDFLSGVFYLVVEITLVKKTKCFVLYVTIVI